MLYIFPFNLYRHYLFAGIGLHLIIVSGYIFRIVMAGGKQDQSYSWDKTVMRPLTAGNWDWNITLRGWMPRQKAGRPEHVNMLQERALSTHLTRAFHRGVWSPFLVILVLTWIDTPLEEHKGRAWISCTSAKGALLKALADLLQWLTLRDSNLICGCWTAVQTAPNLQYNLPVVGSSRISGSYISKSRSHCSRFLFIISDIFLQIFVLSPDMVFQVLRWLLIMDLMYGLRIS